MRGRLTILRGQAQWLVEVPGYRLAVPRAGDTVAFTLPGGRGRFRGRILASGAMAGHWIQPPERSLGLPEYATPIRLSRVAPDAWQGRIRPLDERASIYLWVRRGPAGGLEALLRNPQGWLPAGAYAVQVMGDSVRLAGEDGAAGLAGRLEDGGRALRLTLPGLAEPLWFTRRGRAEAPDFYARTTAPGPYTYHPPVPESDGWSTGTLAAAGIRPDSIAALITRLAAVDGVTPGEPRVQSLLLARHGKLVLEEYFFDAGPDRLHDLRSASKTFASVLVGGAILDGAPVDLRRPVLDYFGDPPVRNADPRKREITLIHLMTMSSGLACDDNDDASPGAEDVMQSQTAQPDWYRYTLDLPMSARPGTRSMYCSAGVNLVGGVLQRATGHTVPELLEELAERLDIDRYGLNLTPTGDGYLGGGLHLRPRDLLKLGVTYLDGGRWRGRQIVSPAWVRASTRRQPELDPRVTDGLDWHLFRIQAGGRTFREYEASGNGGQMLMVLPELDLAVVFTASNYNQYGVWRKLRDEFLPRYLLPAVVSPER